MRYAGIIPIDLINGKGIRVSLFTQGCNIQCYNCFNQELWDINGGKLYTKETENLIISLLGKPYIKGLSILGGEPLMVQNLNSLYLLCKRIKKELPDKDIWLYTGRAYQEIISCTEKHGKDYLLYGLIDVLVDGKYYDSEKDLTLPFRGSKNQRIIKLHN